MPEKTFVLDSSPIILLGKANLLSIISPLAETWIVPKQVITEIEVKRPATPYLKDLGESAKVSKSEVGQIPSVITSWDLGEGENEVLAIALQINNCRAVLDDWQARNCANLLDIPVIGTVGLILRAKRHGYITSAREEIEKLLRCGLYIHPKILEQVYKQVNE